MDRPTVLALCAGIGGLENGLRLAIPTARTLVYCEREAYAAAILLARMEDKSLEPAPVWCGNLEDLPLDPFVDRIDILTAGFPCPPVSVAGKRKGQADERWIWPAIAEIIRTVRPGWVFLENVQGLLSAGAGAAFGEILGDLARIGYDAAWGVFSAAECGAPHRRERVFVLAHHQGGQDDERGGSLGRAECGGQGGNASAGEGGGEPAHSTGEGLQGPRFRGKWESGAQETGGVHGRPKQLCGELVAFEDSKRRRASQVGRPDGIPTVGNPERERVEGDGTGGIAEPSAQIGSSLSGRPGGDIPLWPPGPADAEGWERVLALHPELAPAVWDADTGRTWNPIPAGRPSAGGADRVGESQETQSALRGMDDGLPVISHINLGNCYDQVGGKKNGAKTDPGSRLSGLRENDGEAGTAPSRLQQTARCADIVSQVPQKGGSAGWVCAKGDSSEMLHLQDTIQARAQYARYSLWFVQMQECLRRIVCSEKMGWKEKDEMLCVLWNEISIQEATRSDLWEKVRELAGMDFKTSASRIDRLRALGNAVVPVCAAKAFVTLYWKLVSCPRKS